MTTRLFSPITQQRSKGHRSTARILDPGKVLLPVSSIARVCMYSVLVRTQPKTVRRLNSQVSKVCDEALFATLLLKETSHSCCGSASDAVVVNLGTRCARRRYVYISYITCLSENVKLCLQLLLRLILESARVPRPGHLGNHLRLSPGDLRRVHSTRQTLFDPVRVSEQTSGTQGMVVSGGIRVVSGKYIKHTLFNLV